METTATDKYLEYLRIGDMDKATKARAAMVKEITTMKDPLRGFLYLITDSPCLSGIELSDTMYLVLLHFGMVKAQPSEYGKRTIKNLLFYGKQTFKHKYIRIHGIDKKHIELLGSFQEIVDPDEIVTILGGHPLETINVYLNDATDLSPCVLYKL